jgi:hypothetical protein
VVVVGSIGASMNPAQADLVGALDAENPATVTVALRTPWDLRAYPEAATHVCTYSLLRPSPHALADALFGHASFPGRLPFAIEGLYPRGDGVSA